MQLISEDLERLKSVFYLLRHGDDVLAELKLDLGLIGVLRHVIRWCRGCIGLGGSVLFDSSVCSVSHGKLTFLYFMISKFDLRA